MSAPSSRSDAPPRAMRRNATLRPSASLFTAAASLVASSPLPHPSPLPSPPVHMPGPPPGPPPAPHRSKRPWSRLEDAISLLNGLACAMGIPADPRNDWFLVCVCRHHPDLGLGVLGDAFKRGSPPGASVLDSLIQGLCASRRYVVACKVFDEMLWMGCLPAPRTGGAILVGVCRNGDIGLAVRLLRGWKNRCFRVEPSPTVYNVVLDRLRSCGGICEALEVFQGMVTLGISPDSVTYNVLVKSCCNAGRLDLALKLFGEFLKRGCRAKRGMLNAIILQLVLEGRMKDARALFDCMPGMGCTADVFTCNALIKGLCRAGNMAAVLSLYREVSKPGSHCRPNMFTYNTVIYCLCKEGYLSDAVSLLNEMIVRGHSPNVVTFNILMDFLCKRHWIREAHEMFHLIAKRKLTPTEVSFNTLMHGYCLVGDMDSAREVFDSMSSSNITPGLLSYNILCNGYCKSKKIEYAKRVVRDMKDKGISPNFVTQTILIDAYCKRGRLREACELFFNMNQNGDFSIVAYSSLVDAHCSSGNMDLNDVLRLVGQMECQQDVVFFSIILKDYCNREELREAQKLFAEMWHVGVKPNVIACTTLLSGFFKINDPFSALRLYDKMESWGISFTEVTYKVMVDGLEGALHTITGDTERKELQERVAEISHQLENCHWQMHSDRSIIKAWMRNLI